MLIMALSKFNRMLPAEQVDALTEKIIFYLKRYDEHVAAYERFHIRFQ